MHLRQHGVRSIGKSHPVSHLFVQSHQLSASYTEPGKSTWGSGMWAREPECQGSIHKLCDFREVAEPLRVSAFSHVKIKIKIVSTHSSGGYY